MTEAVFDADYAGGVRAAVPRRRVAGVSRSKSLHGRMLAVALGALVGSSLALGHRLPSGEGLKAMLTKPQIRIDLSLPDAAAECVCYLPVRYADLPPHLIRALIAYEDRRFLVHAGIDWLGLARAAVWTLSGRDVQGGSTITQQLAKNLVVGTERSGLAGLFRKLREAIVARRIEAAMSKDEIITAYFNTADFGRSDGWTAWGIELAARKYFRKAARDLNLYESAQLVGLLGGTSAFSPIRHTRAAVSRTRRVLEAMVAAGFATRSEVAAAIRRGVATGKVAPLQLRPGYFIDAAVREARTAAPATDGTVRLVTTLVAARQNAAEAVVANAVAEGASRAITQGALVSMDLDGAVAALVGGVDYSRSQFNRATDAVRSPGSAFKPFVYLTALQAGYSAETLIVDAPQADGWPRNYAGAYQGVVSLRYAIEHSLNAATVQLAKSIGMIRVAATAHRLGITSPLGADLSTALGSAGVTLLELTAAYGTFAGDGARIGPHFVTAIYAESGRPLFERTALGQQVISRSAAQAMRDLLRGVVIRGTGVQASDPTFWSAGKTGTSQDYRDAWFVGFTKEGVTGVWFGNDDAHPMLGVAGGDVPAQAWRRFHRMQ